jgi:hypothetical protein
LRHARFGRPVASATDRKTTQVATAAGRWSAEIRTEKNEIISVEPKNPANPGRGKSGEFSAPVLGSSLTEPAPAGRIEAPLESWIPADRAPEYRTDTLGRRIDPAGRYLFDLVGQGDGFRVYRGRGREGRVQEFVCWQSDLAKLAHEGKFHEAPPDRRPRALSRAALGKIANNVRTDVERFPDSPAGRKWLLKRRAAPFQRERVRNCRHKRTVKNSVQVSTDGTRVSIAGIETCGSARDCPVCAPNIYAGRAAEIVKACKSHRDRGGTALMLTLTVRHQGCNDLKWLSTGVSEAYRSMRRSRRFQRFWRDNMGVGWVIRGDENTHGPNGWHPHLHVLLFVPKASELAAQAAEAAKTKRGVTGRTSELVYAVYERWGECVERTLGSAFLPTVDRGVVVTLSTDDEYLAKLGLEVAYITEKSGRTDENRTPWERPTATSRRRSYGASTARQCSAVARSAGRAE